MNNNFVNQNSFPGTPLYTSNGVSVPNQQTQMNYNVPLEVGLMTLWKKLNEEGRTITWKLNRDYVHNQMKTMKRLGVRDDINSLDIDDYIDLSYFDNCGAKDFDTFIKEEVDPIFPLGMSYEEWRAKDVELDNIKEESKV